MKAFRKLSMITGSTDGIGFQTALSLSKTTDVIVHGRNSIKTNNKVEELRSQSKNEVDHVIGDLSSLEQITWMCRYLKQRYERLDVLVLNAAICNPKAKGLEYVTLPNEKKVESSFMVNHLANFVLVSELLPLLKRSPQSRIIHVSALLHSTGKYDPQLIETPSNTFEAYTNTKLFNLMFSNTLSRKLKENNILNVTSNAFHPGVYSTNLLLGMGFKGSEQVHTAADTPVYLATEESLSEVSGKFFVKKKTAEPNKNATDETTQEALWKLSEDLLGIKMDFAK